MKLSNKGRYAVRALFDIAFYNEGRPTQLKDIAERQEIPARFLEQIFQDLKRAGFVASKRGPQGGYSLVRTPSELLLGDILEVTEGPCLVGPEDAEATERHRIPDAKSVTDNALQELGALLRNGLNSMSVQTLCERAAQAGLGKRVPERYVYMI